MSLGGVTDLHGNPFKGIRGHNVSIIAPPVSNVGDTEADEGSSLLWVWVGLGAAGGICLCGIMARRLQKASAETRARYQVTVEPTAGTNEAHESAEDGLQRQSFRSKSSPASKLHPSKTGTTKFNTTNGTGNEATKRPQPRAKTMPAESDKFDASGNFDASGTYNFSFTNKSATANSNASKSASKGAKTGAKTPKAKLDSNEEDDLMERSCVDALERSGVQIAQARTIGESLYRQMEERRNDPLNDRKRFFKELLLKWHPDKSSSEFAKDVVRFLQAQKDWFLKE
jgi:hypothetical protein